MKQLELWNQPSPADQRFWDFHKANPHVYSELVKLCQQAKEAGRKRIGIKMLFEVLRWNRFLKTSQEEFKLNNNYHSRYVRIILQQHPEFKGMFELRRIKS